jgi:hypothetical protein
MVMDGVHVCSKPPHPSSPLTTPHAQLTVLRCVEVDSFEVCFWDSEAGDERGGAGGGGQEVVGAVVLAGLC